MRLFKSIFLLAAITLLASCSEAPEQEKSSHQKEKSRSISVAPPVFTEAELAYIDEIKKRGELKVAIRKSQSVYEVNPDGSKGGLHYNLAKSFADYLKVELELKLVNFPDYFSIDGKIPERVYTDPYFSYTPDLINEVDFYAYTMTILPWRQKLLSFVELYPTRMLLVTRQGEEIKSIRGLANKTIITVPGSSYHTRFKELEKDHDLKMKYKYIDDSSLLFNHVSQKDADFTARDANRAVLMIKDYPNLSVNIPLSEVQNLAWAVNKNNRLLASILKKYLSYARKSGVFDKFWIKQYEIDFSEYLMLISYDKGGSNE